MKEQRRLAAVVSADVAGYSRLIGRDETGTLAALKAIRQEVADPAIAAHGGRIVKTTGDGLLLEFPSVVNAVRCAVEVQTAMADRTAAMAEDRRIAFRIGINIGDIIVEGDDIFGDGVNVAARLQEIAAPGGICISSRVHEDVRDHLDTTFDDGGLQTLKNIARPIQIWRWLPGTAVLPKPEPTPTALPLPDKPSIAVLPFLNMSGDPEQEYFTDGVTEDIITELSRFHSLFVIARNSSFSYKGKSPDIRQVGRDLGVRYVLEGSIRKAASRVRVTGQLVDALSGSHIWAERYDRLLEDVFEVQEDLTRSIVRAIAPHISDAEAAKVRRRPESLSAYEIAVRAHTKCWDAFAKSDRALRDEAIADARAAVAIDPGSTLALNAIAFAQWQHLNLGTAQNREAAWHEGMAAATRAIEADRWDSGGYAFKGLLLLFASDRGRIDEAMVSLRHAYELNPHNMTVLNMLAFGEITAGNAEKGIENLHQALRISPRDPQRSRMYFLLTIGSACARQYANGVEYGLLGIEAEPGVPGLHAYLAINYVGLGEIGKAEKALEEARRLAPGFVERGLAGGFVHRDPQHLGRATSFLRIAAGLEARARLSHCDDG
jgi:adenylate cyclase